MSTHFRASGAVEMDAKLVKSLKRYPSVFDRSLGLRRIGFPDYPYCPGRQEGGLT